MPEQPDDLLARLNALKPSSLSFDSVQPSITVQHQDSLSIEDKLAERLKGLRSGDLTSTTRNDAESDTVDSLVAQSKDDASIEANDPDPIKDWQRSGDEEQTLEELLAELGPDDQWELEENDSKNIDSLLNEAKAALPAEPVTSAEDGVNEDDGNPLSAEKMSTEFEDGNGAKRTNEDQLDDEEADDYVKRVLAELAYEKAHGIEDPDEESATDERGDQAMLNLPSTPANMPPHPTSTEPPSYEDSELEARFSKLGLDLPSTPNTAPSARAKAASKAHLANLKNAKAKSNLPTYTNEDIDSWCCICNEDGEVKCLGCDGDIYCQKCWREGHGTGPGQEKGHRAVQFNKKGPAAAAA